MDKEKALEIFKKSGALLNGHFRLTSGLHSPHYFQCAKVLQYPEYMSQFCTDIVEHYQKQSIDCVISPAIGGIVVGTEVGRQLGVRTIFAERREGEMTIRRGFEIQKDEKVLVVEDVVTTGGSVQEVIDLVKAAGATVIGVGFIVDRSGGKKIFNEPAFACFQMDVVIYQPDDCPLCSQNVPIEKPGSRKID